MFYLSNSPSQGALTPYPYVFRFLSLIILFAFSSSVMKLDLYARVSFEIPPLGFNDDGIVLLSRISLY